MTTYKEVSPKPLSEVESKTTYSTKGKVEKGEKLKGGKGDNRPDSDFNSEQLRIGTNIEFEHTKDRAKAKEIAKDHLTESDEYYKRLNKMEKEMKKSFARANDLIKKFKSKDQQKYMYAAAERGEIPKKVVEEFSDKTKDFSKLPEDVDDKDDKVKKAHDGITPYTQGDPIIGEHLSPENTSGSQVFVTPNNSDPGGWAGSSTRDQSIEFIYELSGEKNKASQKNKSRKNLMHKNLERANSLIKALKEAIDEEEMDLKKKNEDEEEAEKSVEDSPVSKALKAMDVLGLSRRERLAAAYRLGVAEGNKAVAPFHTEEVSVPEDVGIEKSKLRPSHEPPVVPVRRIETQYSLPARKFEEPTYRVNKGGPEEAEPFWSK